ncbi:MAG: biosynthetic arginine decarboxylase [Candidatus Eisenbacteria sp.]|nr:biosynthetic arginine decarboxylase [Candidatus Eisenbacteria bacterium]
MARNGKIQSPYGIDEWGAGYFAIGPAGHLLVRPFRDARTVDLTSVVRLAAGEGLAPPLLVRFPQVLQTQLKELYRCFDRAREEFGYRPSYRSVYPLKVNPMKPVVESLIAAGRPDAFGLEVGSKPELAIALSRALPPGSWICINGFKDPTLVTMAARAAAAGVPIVLVIERLREISMVIDAVRRERSAPLSSAPLIGLRCRLYQRGSGRWEASGGETAKFGLGSSELLYAVDALRREELLDRLRVLHYHIGSQITSVRRIKDAVKEAARIYAKLRQHGAPLTTLNVGGGLGIDYDGSGTPSDSSVNYTMQEFANNVVYTVQEVCEEEEVPTPDLVSESGRALTAHHSLLITNCESRESDAPLDYAPDEVPGAVEKDQDDLPPQLLEMEEIAREISVKNFREYYHDAVVTRGEIINLFDLGYLSLERKARAEQDFYRICRRALAFARQTDHISDEFRVLEKTFRAKYVTNFSVFHSVPDAWAIEQLFPVVPIHRLGEPATVQGILVDLTCDSDGVIDSFTDVRDVKEVLELHASQPGRPYLLAIALLGAYQDVMGDHHNLFGKPAEVLVTYHKKDPELEVVSRGETIGELARLAGYAAEEARAASAARASTRSRAGGKSPGRTRSRGAGRTTAPDPAAGPTPLDRALEGFRQRSPYLEDADEDYRTIE